MHPNIKDMLKRHGLLHLSDDFDAYIRWSLRLETTSITNGDIKVGSSKIGGLPDLPINVEWPIKNDKHLAFVAQINLSELPNVDYLKILPEKGILFFFYTFSQDVWGFDPKDKGAWRVIYTEAKDLSRCRLPKDLIEEMGEYSSCAVKYFPSLTIPNSESIYMEDFGLEVFNNNYMAFEEEFNSIHNSTGIIHRLLGHPDTIQNPMEEECQLVTNGIYYGDAKWREDPKAESLKCGIKNWHLLLQIDSDDKTGMMWGDVGRIYYWIRKGDLLEKNFNNVWFSLQCC